jgi:hypothetical protein
MESASDTLTVTHSHVMIGESGLLSSGRLLERLEANFEVLGANYGKDYWY